MGKNGRDENNHPDHPDYLMRQEDDTWFHIIFASFPRDVLLSLFSTAED